MTSLSKRQNKRGICASCGAWWKGRLYVFPEAPESNDLPYRLYADPDYPLCEECIHRWNAGDHLRLMFASDLSSLSGSPAEEFAEMLKAAQILLKEPITDEDQIVPTLLAAYQVDRGMAHWKDAKETVIRNNLKHVPPRYPGAMKLAVVKVVDGILLLEREPVFAELVQDLIVSGMVWDGAASQLVSRSWKEDGSKPLASRWKSRSPSWQSMDGQARSDRTGVLIRVYPYRRAIQPREVASRYQEVLETRRLSYGGARDALIEYEFWNNCLYLLVAAGGQVPRDEVSFPSPQLVESFSGGMLQEFSDRLVTRKAGKKTDAENLIPACVAFLLRASHGVESPKKVHQVLNDHILDESWKDLALWQRLPRDGSTNSASRQLWGNVKKAQKQIMRVLDRV
jgi:hypothetical protein